MDCLPQPMHQPHPEHSTGASDGNGRCHTGDVAAADRTGQNGAQSLKGLKLTVSTVGGASGLILAEHLAKGLLDPSADAQNLKEARADGEVQADADHQHEQRCTPQKGC